MRPGRSKEKGQFPRGHVKAMAGDIESTARAAPKAGQFVLCDCMVDISVERSHRGHELGALPGTADSIKEVGVGGIARHGPVTCRIDCDES